MLVGTALVTLLFAGGVVGWRMLGDGDSATGRDGATWSQVALVDRVSGDVTLVDESGEVVGESAGHGRTGSLYAADGALALGNSRTLTVLTDPDADPDSASDDGSPVVVDLPAGGQVTPIRTASGTYLALGSPAGGDVVLVEMTTGDALDIGALVADASPTTPKMFVETLRVDHAATMFAIADAASFQTIVVRPGDPDVVFLADQPIAVGEELVATSQTVGLQADVALVDLERSVKASVPTQIPAGGIGVMSGDTLTMVSVDGGVFRIEPGDDAANRLGAVAVPAGGVIQWVRPTFDGERLVVSGDTFEAVVDLDGRTLFTTTFASPVETPFPDPTWSCLPIGGEGGYHSIIDLVSGEQLADLSGVDELLGTSDDGCTVLARRASQAEVIGPDGSVTVGPLESAVLGPDGRSIVRITADGTRELVTIDDDLSLGTPIDLTALAAPDALVAFIPDHAP
jgi:hypothetical protein